MTRREIVFTAPYVAVIAAMVFLGDVPLKAFILGSGSWGAGVLLKMLLYQGVIRRLPHEGPAFRWVSLFHGIMSGVTELGLAAVALQLLDRPGFADIVAFGIGIGAIEASFTAMPKSPFAGTRLESAEVRLEEKILALPGPKRTLHALILPFIERIFATGVHVGTRGLVFLGMKTGAIWMFAAALAFFPALDGVGYYLIYRRRLEDFRTLNRLYAWFAVLAVIAVGAFLLAWRAHPTGSPA